MTLGEKIRHLRTQKKMTQSRLAGDKITRNMLSAIESDKANPSLATLKYLSDALSVPLPYLLSVENDYYLYEKNEIIDEIYSAYSAKAYKSVIKLSEKLSKIDDEIAYILAATYLEIAKDNFKNGAMKTAADNLNKAIEYSDRTVHNTAHISAVAKMYHSVIKNIQSPLLELDFEGYLSDITRTFEFEMFKYITQDSDYKYTNKAYEEHLAAKKLIKERDYVNATERLLSAAEINIKDGYDAFLMFSIYSDLENCYKQLYDFENAYKYSSKRLSLIEGFKS